MVNLEYKLKQIRELIDEGAYFTINRARQYGKTTILNALVSYLQTDYIVVSLDFQALGNASFQDENSFSLTFASYFLRELQWMDYHNLKGMENAISGLESAVEKRDSRFALYQLFDCLISICSSAPKPIVLMIDEADSATNNQVFLDFLAQVRFYYLERDKKETPAFWSVILAGVYDVKNLKGRYRSDEEHKRNSPWNIAVKFKVDMSFSIEEIAGMLYEYEMDHKTGMDVFYMAQLLHDDTSGYPYLVSDLCKIMDEDLTGTKRYPDKSSVWSEEGFLEAERILLSEKNTLFESLINKLIDYPELNNMLYSMLFTGKNIVFNPDNPALDIAVMFGFVMNNCGSVVLANRIFEIRLYNYYLSSNELQNLEMYKLSLQDRIQFITEGRLNMRLVIERFVAHFTDLYGDRPETFLKEEGRKFFLLYLRPIINGTGNYYIEARTRGLRRTDVIVDYHGEQFIIELKIGHGEEYNRRGEEQLAGYLDAYHTKVGYMISFNFNRNKQIGVHEIAVGDKLIIEAVV